VLYRGGIVAETAADIGDEALLAAAHGLSDVSGPAERSRSTGPTPGLTQEVS